MTQHGCLLNRRELLGLFGAAMFMVRHPAVQEPAPEFNGLDHIEFYVSNVGKSRDLFVRIFGNTVLSRNNKRYLKLGSTYMAFEQPREANGEIKVDHVSIAIKKLEMSRLHVFLEQRGVAYQDYPSGRDTAVVDPDGIRLQLSPENGWSLLNPATFLPEVVAVSEEPIFRPIGMDHVVLNVKQSEQAVGFYQKFLGAPVQRANNRTWFQVGTSRVGLQQVADGERVGVRYFAITAAAFAPEAATRRLQQLGVRVESPEVGGTVRFRDIDGSMIQVMPASN